MARWGAIVIFSIAIVYALVLVLRWALLSWDYACGGA